MTSTNKSEEDFNELSFYTLSHNPETFIHQHIVDAQGAQTADLHTKQIRVIFSLVGLCLYLEKDFTGKQVQHFHMKMAKNKIKWPDVELPNLRGAIFVSDVLEAPEGAERDKMIHDWCVEVWDAYKSQQSVIVDLIKYFESR